MAIPKWRHVEGTDDGCGISQCLSCYATWEGRSWTSEWSFCPYCGIKWEGQHECHDRFDVREHRWFTRVHNREPKDWMELSDWTKTTRRDKPKNDRCWIVERKVRSGWTFTDPEWEKWCTFELFTYLEKEFRRHNAKSVKARVDSMRKEDADGTARHCYNDLRYDFRVKIGVAKSDSYFGLS